MFLVQVVASLTISLAFFAASYFHVTIIDVLLVKMLQSRLLRQIAIDGTEALCSQTPQSPPPAPYWSGGKLWQDLKPLAKKSTNQRRVQTTAAPGKPATRKSQRIIQQS